MVDLRCSTRSSRGLLNLIPDQDSMGLIVREYAPTDATALRTCVVVLQDSERGIDPLLRAGEAMADDYCERIQARCRDADGRIFVAEHDRAAGARELRIGVLAQNNSARRLYLAAEFLPYQEILAKRW